MLPNMTETKIVVTGNLRAWFEFCARRTQPDADAEIRHVAEVIYEQLGLLAPSIFSPKEEEQKTYRTENQDLVYTLQTGDIISGGDALFRLKGRGEYQAFGSSRLFFAANILDLADRDGVKLKLVYKAGKEEA